MVSESQSQREARVKALWERLNVDGRSSLDLQGLKHGLKSIGHPLAAADDLIRNLLRSADINRDGHITYQEFCQFVAATEAHLRNLFETIDKDHNGRLEIRALRDAFLRAGVAVPNENLEHFFHDVDRDHDGSICFSEWRDFLLFIPQSGGLRDLMSTYRSTVRVNVEGNSHLHDEAIQNIGSTPRSLMYQSFGLVPYIISSITRSDYAQSTTRTNELDVRIPRSPPVLKPPDLAPSDREVSRLAATQQLPEIKKSRSLRKVLTALLPDPGYFLAGGLSGVTSRTLTAPLDRLKVKLIAQTDSASAIVNGTTSPPGAGRSGANTLTRAMRDLWAAGGVRSLFAGNGINVVKVMPESAVKFGSYEATKRFISQFEGHNDPKRISQVSQFVAGGVAGMISQAFTYPLDTLKFRMQNETVKGGLRGNALILATARKMWITGGVRSFYKGLTMGLVGMFPYAAIDLGTFELCKRKLVARNVRKYGTEPDSRPNNFTLALIGGFSGAFGASVVYPLNLLRTRLQSQGTASHPRTYTGMFDVARQTVRGEGYRGLFKGLTPNLLKVIPAVSITYVVYENAKRALNLR